MAEHGREKEFVQTQQEIALANAGRKGTDIQQYGNSHKGHGASLGGIKVLAETGIGHLASGPAMCTVGSVSTQSGQ